MKTTAAALPKVASLLFLGQQGLVLMVLGTVPMLFGAVQPWVWTGYTILCYAALALMAGDGLQPLNGWWWWVFAFFFLTLVPVVPLPRAMIAGLAPVRFEWLAQAWYLTGIEPVWWTIGYAPLDTFAWWAFLAGLAGFFAVLSRCLANQTFALVFLWVIFFVAVMEALYGILQALIPNLGVLWVTHTAMGDARGTYINRNHFAGFMEMTLPFLMGFALSRVRWRGRLNVKGLLHSERLHQHLLMVLALVVMALALLFSRSRGGITGTVVGLLVFFGLVRASADRMPKGVWAVSALFLVLTVVYGLQMGFMPIIERFLMLEEGNSRLDFWRDSLPIIASHPFGIGLGAFKTVFPLYHASSLSESAAAVYLHNDVLQLVVEAGWLGAAVLIGTFLVYMGVMFRRIRAMAAWKDPRRFFLAVGAFSGLVALCFHSFFDFNLQIPANAVYFVTLMAVVRVAVKEDQSRTAGSHASFS